MVQPYSSTDTTTASIREIRLPNGWKPVNSSPCFIYADGDIAFRWVKITIYVDKFNQAQGKIYGAHGENLIHKYWPACLTF